MEGARPVRLGIMNFTNFIWDQLLATGGTQSYCIRWESTGTLTKEKVAEIEADLEVLANTWFDYLQGYNCWPFGHVPVKVVGVAVADRNRADWADGEGVPVYVGDMFENAPQCPQACGRFFHQDNDYSGCPGGEANHYDRSLWLTDGGSGSGGDWGMRMAPGDFNMAGMAWLSIHEFGHGLGFPDYYNWDIWTGGVAQPVAIMSNSPNEHETDWDVAMLKYVWDRVQARLL